MLPLLLASAELEILAEKKEPLKKHITVNCFQSSDPARSMIFIDLFLLRGFLIRNRCQKVVLVSA